MLLFEILEQRNQIIQEPSSHNEFQQRFRTEMRRTRAGEMQKITRELFHQYSAQRKRLKADHRRRRSRIGSSDSFLCDFLDDKI